MSYDELLAGRVRAFLGSRVEAERKMFGGLAFMVQGRMACCVSGSGGLLVKVGAERMTAALQRDGVAPMVMGERVSDSWVQVPDSEVTMDEDLAHWIEIGLTAHPARR